MMPRQPSRGISALLAAVICLLASSLSSLVAAESGRSLHSGHHHEHPTAVTQVFSESLVDGEVELHWQIKGSHITFTLDVITSGWVGLGWSLTGKMVLSEAVIANIEPSEQFGGQEVDFVKLSGYSAAGIRPSKAVTLTNVSLTSEGGKTSLSFTRPLVGGVVSLVESNGVAVNLVWAHAAESGRELAFHGANKGSTTINLNIPPSTLKALNPSAAGGTEVVSEEEGDDPGHDHDGLELIFILHGLFMVLAFLLLMPAAIIVARLYLVERTAGPLSARDALRGGGGGVAAGEVVTTKDGLVIIPAEEDPDEAELEAAEREMALAVQRAKAFRTHMWLQVAGVACTLLGCLLLLAVEGTEGMVWGHAQFGLVIVVAVLVQVLLGFFRPERSSPARRLWALAHWGLGLSCVVGGCINIFLGVNLFGLLFDMHVVVAMLVVMLLFVAAVAFYFLLFSHDFRTALPTFPFSRHAHSNGHSHSHSHGHSHGGLTELAVTGSAERSKGRGEAERVTLTSHD